MMDRVKSSINALVDSDPQHQALPDVASVGGHPSRRGRSVYAGVQAASGSGGGIASPLTEKGAWEREHYPDETLYSGDLLLGIQVRALKTLNLTDADGNPVVANFADPKITEQP